MNQIDTERCFLARLTISDVEEAIKIDTNAETREFLGGALSPEQARQKLCMTIKSGENLFGVRLKESHCFIGLIYIEPYYDPEFYEISYEFLPNFWGKVYAYEVMKACLEYCKKEKNLNFVVAETQKKNVRSRKLLERLGYQLVSETTRFQARQSIYRICLKDKL